MIKEMQAVNESLETIDTPACAVQAKAALDNYMVSEIQCAFGLFAAESIEGTREMPTANVDACHLKSDQFTYYQIKMEELNDLLAQK